MTKESHQKKIAEAAMSNWVNDIFYTVVLLSLLQCCPGEYGCCKIYVIISLLCCFTLLHLCIIVNRELLPQCFTIFPFFLLLDLNKVCTGLRATSTITGCSKLLNMLHSFVFIFIQELNHHENANVVQQGLLTTNSGPCRSQEKWLITESLVIKMQKMCGQTQK